MSKAIFKTGKGKYHNNLTRVGSNDIIILEGGTSELLTVDNETKVLSSNSITLVQDYTFSAPDFIYKINGNIIYADADPEIILSPADATLNRIDTIVGTFDPAGNGYFQVLQGDLAENPVKRTVDATSQIELTFVYVAAGTTTPNGGDVTDATELDLSAYLQDLQSVTDEGAITTNNVSITEGSKLQVLSSDTFQYTDTLNNGFYVTKLVGAAAYTANFRTDQLLFHYDSGITNNDIRIIPDLPISGSTTHTLTVPFKTGTIALLDDVGGSQNLQSVTDLGNTTSNSVIVNSTAKGAGFKVLKSGDDTEGLITNESVSITTPNESSSLSTGLVVAGWDSGVTQRNIKLANGSEFIDVISSPYIEYSIEGKLLNINSEILSDHRVQTFQDKSGTIALLDDIDTLKQKEVTAATYTITDADNGYTIWFNNATGVTVTVNTLVTDSFECDFYNEGVGSVSFVDGTAIVGKPDGSSLETDKVATLLRKLATTTYKLKGELV